MKMIRFVIVLGLSINIAYAQTVPSSVYDGLNLDAVAPVGQFVVGNGYNMTNAPFGDTNYWNVLSMRHHNPANSFITQIAGEFFGSRLAFRNTNSVANHHWFEIYHSGNLPALKTALNLNVNNVRWISNDNIDLNDHAYASSMGKLLNGANAPVTYGQFLSFGTGDYSTQFNSQHYANGLTYIRVNGDGGLGNWRTLYHSGMAEQIKSDLAINLQDVANSGYIISKEVNSIEPDFIRMKNAKVNPNTLGLGVHGTLGYAYIQSSNEGINYENPIALQPNGGNVGIGITNPQEKLAVNGKIRAKEIKVEIANWPDYVFEDGYKLKSLEEIDEFVKLNKHLPEVPSAKEVAQNGIELGEMNKILLKKIEELTLHLIAKDKEIQQLKVEKSEKEEAVLRALMKQNDEIQILKKHLNIN